MVLQSEEIVERSPEALRFQVQRCTAAGQMCRIKNVRIRQGLPSPENVIGNWESAKCHIPVSGLAQSERIGAY